MDLRDLVSLGKESFDKKDYKSAEKYLSKVLKTNKGYADVFNMLGVIYQERGDYDDAIGCFKKALKVNPNYTEARLNLVVLYNDLGNYKEAKKLYENFSKKPKKISQGVEPVLRGKLSNLHSDIGDIYRSIGLYDLAVDEYKKSLSLNADYHDIRTKLGRTLRDSGRLKESERELKKVLTKKTSYVPARVQLGITCYALGKRTAAKNNWKVALKTDPGNSYARMYMRLLEI